MTDSIGARLRSERKKQLLSQTYLAKELGVSRESIRSWEHETPIKSTNLFALSTLGFDIQYIITGQHALNLNHSAIKKLQHPDNSREWRFAGDFLSFINLIMEKK